MRVEEIDIQQAFMDYLCVQWKMKKPNNINV